MNAVWRWPLWIGALTGAGLLSALIGDGVFDSLSWFLTAAPLAAIALALKKASAST